MARSHRSLLWIFATLIYVAMFATWDYGATCLFLGAIVPIHILMVDRILRYCPPSFFPTALAASRLSLLVPVVAAALGH